MILYDIPANIGANALMQKCIEGLHSAWDHWSYRYPLDEGQMKLLAVVPKGHKMLFGDNCLLECFLKKSRSPMAVPNYDFSIVLELNLSLTNVFYEAATDNRLREQNQTQVCGLYTQQIGFSQPVIARTSTYRGVGCKYGEYLTASRC